MGAVIADRQEAAVVLLGIGERSWARIHRNYPTKTKSYCGTKCGTTTNINRIKLIITIGYIILMAEREGFVDISLEIPRFLVFLDF